MEGTIKRVELSCHTYYSPMDGVLSPEEWVNIAWHGVRALAITDFQDVFAFWETAQAVEDLRRKVEPGKFDFKVLYGLETVLEDGCLVHLLVQSQEGLEHLYRLLEIACQEREQPFLRKSEISEYRSGLLIGCPGKDGELYREILEHLDDAYLEEIAGFYDYLSVLRPEHYGLLSPQEYTLELPEAEDLIRKTIALGKRLDKPVAAAGNARLVDADWCMCGNNKAYCILKDKDWHFDDFIPNLPGAEEMLEYFSFLEKELAEEIVIHAPNHLADLCQEIQILPEDERCLQPILPGAFETVASLCQEQLLIRYNGEIPEEAQERLEYELANLKSRELDSSILLSVYRLVQELRKKGHLLAARGCLPEFYTAYLLGVTEADPLALRIPRESLWGQEQRLLHIDFHASEECWEDVIEIFSQMFPQGMTVYGRWGRSIGDKSWDMIAAYTAKYKQNWPDRLILECASRLWRTHQSRCDKILFYPYAQFLVPDAVKLRHWMPVYKLDGKYTLPDYEGFPALFRLVLVPKQLLGLLRRMEKLTGVLQSSINAEEAVPLLVQDQTDIPVFGTLEVQTIWRLAKPKTMEDITKISSLSYSTGAWKGNAEELLREGIVPFSEIIGSREDVFNFLLDAGLERAFAYLVMERVRRGKGLEEECTFTLRQCGIPEWFINSCNKIQYLFPKAFCAEVDAIPALKAAWYKTYFPKEYAQAYSELYTK